jgi:bifunctional DNase/RNase
LRLRATLFWGATKPRLAFIKIFQTLFFRGKRSSPEGTTMLRMNVDSVGFDLRKQTVVVLKDWDGRKILPIWIGANEAKAIAWELEGLQAPRPGSHDLLLACIRQSSGRVVRVVINDLQDGTFYATIDIDTSEGVHHIDARPSDAIALAVRAKCPLFIDGSALGALVDIGEGGLQRVTPAEDSDELEPDELTPEWNNEAVRPQRDDELDRFKRLLGDLMED